VAPGFTVYDATGRMVPLVRIHPGDPTLDGLGFFKSKRLKKLWKKIRKPLVGAAVLGAGVLTGGAALAAAPAVIGAVTGGASALLPGAAAVLPAAASLIGGGGGAPAAAAEAVPVMAAAPVATAAAAPAPAPAPAPAAPRQRKARTVGNRRSDRGGLSGPLFIGGGLAALALVLLVQRSSSGKG
jgi:hypothetical protein